jgi:hypothetical protein
MSGFLAGARNDTKEMLGMTARVCHAERSASAVKHPLKVGAQQFQNSIFTLNFHEKVKSCQLFKPKGV